MDPEPDESVTAVEDAHLVTWQRDGSVWWGDTGKTTTFGDTDSPYLEHLQWHELLRRGPLTDATGRAS